MVRTVIAVGVGIALLITGERIARRISRQKLRKLLREV